MGGIHLTWVHLHAGIYLHSSVVGLHNTRSDYQMVHVTLVYVHSCVVGLCNTKVYYHGSMCHMCISAFWCTRAM